MLPEEISRLDRVRSEILQNVVPTDPPFLDHLQSKGVLSSYDVEQITNIARNQTNFDAIRKLLHIYSRKANSLDPLIEALDNCCYADLVTELTQPAFADTAVQSPSSARKVTSNIISLGGVPRNPHVYVERLRLLDELRAALLEIGTNADGGWVVVHGMGGAGKSVLAAAILSDPSITGSTFTSIYWLYIGPHGDDKLLSILEKLFSKVDVAERDLNLKDVDMAVEKLRNAFIYDCPGALVILDDVWTEPVVRAFDSIRCRVLVTTRQTDVVDVIDAGKVFVRIPDSGFELNEAKKAFADWVNADVADLPAEAELIYKQTDGHPFEISLIGSLLRDFPNRWRRYYEQLRERKLAEIKKRTAYKFDSFVAAVSISLEALPEDMRKLFFSLGVFQRGMEISSQVLTVYWEKEETSVEDIMLAFTKRSLVEKRNRSTSSGESYRIHILLHDLIKTLNGRDVQESLHKELLDRYRSKSDGHWDRLPLDRYSYENIAYHFYRSRKNDAPWEVFLDLKFVVEKLIQCGPVQTLTDYQRYGCYISRKGADSCNEFQEFIKRNMHHLLDNRLLANAGVRIQILGLALEEPAYSTVCRQAAELNEELRFSIPRPSSEPESENVVHPTISLRYDSGGVKQAVWLSNGDRDACLLLHEKGHIRVCSVYTGKEFVKIEMERPACSISLSPNFQRALACCDAELVAYDLENVMEFLESDSYALTYSSEGFDDFRTPSPLLNARLAELNGNSENNGLQQHGFTRVSNGIRRYRWCEISHDDSKAITGDSENSLLIWDLRSDRVSYEILTGHTGPVNCCKYNVDDQLIVSASDDGTAIVWNSTNRKKVYVFDGHGKKTISTCCWIDNGGFKNCVLTCSYAEFALWSTGNGRMRMMWKADATATCVDTSKCGNYIAAGLVDSSIVIWQLTNDSASLFSVIRSRSKAVPTSVRFHNNNAQLLSSRDDGTVEILKVTQQMSVQPSSNSSPYTEAM